MGQPEKCELPSVSRDGFQSVMPVPELLRPRDCRDRQDRHSSW